MSYTCNLHVIDMSPMAVHVYIAVCVALAVLVFAIKMKGSPSLD